MDFYKRWFLAAFLSMECLAAVPMLTEDWTAPGNADVYSRLLDVDVIQPARVPDVGPGHKARDDYFRPVQEAHRDRDVFFDPDTGLRVGPRRPARRRFDEYLFAEELVDRLVPEGSRRLAVVYDQSIARGGEVESAERKLQELHERGLCALAYCAQAAMVVVSRDRERVEDLYRRALAMGYLPRDRVRVRPKVFQA